MEKGKVYEEEVFFGAGDDENPEDVLHNHYGSGMAETIEEARTKGAQFISDVNKDHTKIGEEPVKLVLYRARIVIEKVEG